MNRSCGAIDRASITTRSLENLHRSQSLLAVEAKHTTFIYHKNRRNMRLLILLASLALAFGQTGSDAPSMGPSKSLISGGSDYPSMSPSIVPSGIAGGKSSDAPSLTPSSSPSMYKVAKAKSAKKKGSLKNKKTKLKSKKDKLQKKSKKGKKQSPKSETSGAAPSYASPTGPSRV